MVPEVKTMSELALLSLFSAGHRDITGCLEGTHILVKTMVLDVEMRPRSLSCTARRLLTAVWLMSDVSNVP